MADEVKVMAQLVARLPGLTRRCPQDSERHFTFDGAGQTDGGIQVVGTSAESLTIGDASFTPGGTVLFLHNQGPGTIDVYGDEGPGIRIFAQLKPGDVSLYELDAGMTRFQVVADEESYLEVQAIE